MLVLVLVCLCVCVCVLVYVWLSRVYLCCMCVCSNSQALPKHHIASLSSPTHPSCGYPSGSLGFGHDTVEGALVQELQQLQQQVTSLQGLLATCLRDISELRENESILSTQLANEERRVTFLMQCLEEAPRAVFVNGGSASGRKGSARASKRAGRKR